MKINQKILYGFFKLLSGLFRILGLNGTRFLAKQLGTFFYYVIPIRKKVVLENLAIAFPEKSLEERKRITLGTYRNVVTTFLELLHFPNISKSEMKAMLLTPNLDLVNELIKEKNGIVFWTGHFGSWEVGGSAASLHFNQPFHVLAKKQSNYVVNEYIKNAREAHGNKMVWLGASVRHLLEVLRDGGIVGVVGDQRGPVDSPRVSFFGKPTPFYIGTATIIAKTNCNVIFGVVVRQKDGNYVGSFEALNKEILPQELNSKIIAINQQYANFLEKMIRQYPDQYFWMHKIWKY
ncbi:MAG: lysophospholipid acyltransferase family protein [Melioribacteraceae bacterium]